MQRLETRNLLQFFCEAGLVSVCFDRAVCMVHSAAENSSDYLPSYSADSYGSRHVGSCYVAAYIDCLISRALWVPLYRRGERFAAQKRFLSTALLLTMCEGGRGAASSSSPRPSLKPNNASRKRALSRSPLEYSFDIESLTRSSEGSLHLRSPSAGHSSPGLARSSGGSYGHLSAGRYYCSVFCGFIYLVKMSDYSGLLVVLSHHFLLHYSAHR